ncbi:MAG: type II toxin-antitoxin system RelE/ParE family toxin, partial [Clostridiales bacterium]|nr:type II toxin-antitoxin system RelE/ParE family toxin [Clostridiales bacterium]
MYNVDRIYPIQSRKGIVMYEIVFYEKENGEEPAYVFLNSLSAKMQSRLLYKMELLEMQGPALREPHSKYLEDKILKLRAEV